jgi:hypothetical protein
LARIDISFFQWFREGTHPRGPRGQSSRAAEVAENSFVVGQLTDVRLVQQGDRLGGEHIERAHRLEKCPPVPEVHVEDDLVRDLIEQRDAHTRWYHVSASM